MNKEQIGAFIAFRRQYLGLNQEDLAEMADITAKTIYKIETGIGNPSLETLEKLMNVLGLEITLSIKTPNE